MTARPRASFILLSSVPQVGPTDQLGPFQEACLKLADQLKGNAPQTKNGVEARLEKSTSVLLGNRWFLCFRETGIARTKVLEVAWGADTKTPHPIMTQRAYHLDALRLVQSFLKPVAPAPVSPEPRVKL